MDSMTNSLIIDIDAQKADCYIGVHCGCGSADLDLPYNPDWSINIIDIQFICKCGRIFNVPNYLTESLDEMERSYLDMLDKGRIK